MRTFFTFLFTCFMLQTIAQEIPMFVGTYTNKGSQGIYLYMFNTEAGEAMLSANTAAEDPSFLSRSKDGKMVYAVKERDDSTASLSAFAFNGDGLSFVNTLPTDGGAPCHVVVSKKYPLALVSNYSGGSLSVFKLEDNGALGAQIQHIQQEGTGPNKDRQEASHVHSAFFSADEKHVFVQNLGTDKITIYRVEKEKDTYKLSEESQIATPAGGGPRHLVLDAKEKNLYVLLEMTAQIAHYTKEGNTWKLQDTVSINDAAFAGKNGAAEIKFSPDFKFIYASNRGDANSIALFQVDKNGNLHQSKVYSTNGKEPRNFNISPDGRFLLVANQSTDDITVFKRDVRTGELTDTAKSIAVPTPVCIIF
ncbi:lactonase family protein [Sphingobacterium oryzagri]|uniref:Lactonase family protein n=1 Tax=Sphingobacterium oryzagri TaxID=3025669 RepID=A0ABY7WQ51_9SPHI|nr:lactonase family protein [Sphingobacterium sp. KACC 22765]WDF69464.1 lactonase family protein [Sphingobacterium sp. KACC 22765]